MFKVDETPLPGYAMIVRHIMVKKQDNIIPIDEQEYQKEVYEWQRKVYEDNMRLWESFDQTSTNMDARFDKALFTIAAGSFGISFAFIDKFVKIAEAIYPKILVASWACFALCLVIMAIGHLMSAKAYGKLRDDVAKNMALLYEGKPVENKQFGDSVSPCNYIALISFIGGMVCLLLFVLLNL